MLSSQEICVITPTKGRHRLLEKMLDSLANQSVHIGQVIVADGGRDAEHVINGFKDRLPIEWLDCSVAGQIPQRNMALARVRDDIKVIIYFDDDICQEPDALENLIAFWNSLDVEPAGVSFNLFGVRKQKSSFLRSLFFMPLSPEGKVLRSGYNTPITGVQRNYRTQWLLGGATAWRRDILEREKHTGIASRWAICEDLIFSYPIGKSEDLYVCASARVRDVDTPAAPNYAQMRFRGRNAVLWRYYFVSSHEELSELMFFWMILGQALPRLFQGLTGNTAAFGHGLGQLEGFYKCVRARISGAPIADILE